VPFIFLRAAVIVISGQPSFLARSETECEFRLSAAPARIAVAPLAAKARIRSSSSAVQGFEILRKLVTKDHGCRREARRANGDHNRRPVFEGAYGRFHQAITH
jgi:hypothetical protein